MISRAPGLALEGEQEVMPLAVADIAGSEVVGVLLDFLLAAGEHLDGHPLTQ